MKKTKSWRHVPLLAALPLLLAGCLLISGTFLLAIMLVSGEDLAWNDEYYYDSVDFTSESVWEDHSDNLQYIDVVGFELWATNDLASAETYDLYLAGLSSSLTGSSPKATVESSATQVLNDVPIAAGPGGHTYISYPESFSYSMNTDAVRSLTEQGGFKLFLIPSNNSTSLTVDSLKVVVTFTAGT